MDHAYEPDKVCLVSLINILSVPNSFRTKAVTSNWTLLVSLSSGMIFHISKSNKNFMKETQHTIDVVPKHALMPVIQAWRVIIGEIDTESKPDLVT